MLGKRLVLSLLITGLFRVGVQGPHPGQRAGSRPFQPGLPTWLEIFGSGRRQGFAFSRRGRLNSRQAPVEAQSSSATVPNLGEKSNPDGSW